MDFRFPSFSKTYPSEVCRIYTGTHRKDQGQGLQSRKQGFKEREQVAIGERRISHKYTLYKAIPEDKDWTGITGRLSRLTGQETFDSLSLLAITLASRSQRLQNLPFGMAVLLSQ